MVAESRCLDRKFALRPWTRLQRGVWGLQLTWLEAGTRITTRLWQKNLSAVRCCA